MRAGDRSAAERRPAAAGCAERRSPDGGAMSGGGSLSSPAGVCVCACVNQAGSSVCVCVFMGVFYNCQQRYTSRG